MILQRPPRPLHPGVLASASMIQPVPIISTDVSTKRRLIFGNAVEVSYTPGFESGGRSHVSSACNGVRVTSGRSALAAGLVRFADSGA